MHQSLPNSVRHLGSLLEQGWLSRQTLDFQERIATAGRFIMVERGRPLYQVGDPPDALYGLESGMVDISVPVRRDEEVTVHRAGPGFWVGDSAILAEATRTLSVTAARDSRLFRVAATDIRQMLDRYPEDWKRFYQLNHGNGSMAITVLAEVISLPARARFARILLRMADDEGVIHMTQDDLSRMAGMSRATFRRSFAALIAQSIIRTDYGSLCILDRSALETEAMRT